MNQDWLSQLAADHAPPSAPWFPPAPGWWLVALALVLLVVALVAWWRRPAARLRRATLREIASLDRASSDDHAFAQALENLLRRFAVARFGRDAVSPLCGEAWLTFLAAHGARAFAGDPGRALLRAAYGGGANPSRAEWLSGARGFVKGDRNLALRHSRESGNPVLPISGAPPRGGPLACPATAGQGFRGDDVRSK